MRVADGRSGGKYVDKGPAKGSRHTSEWLNGKGCTRPLKQAARLEYVGVTPGLELYQADLEGLTDAEISAILDTQGNDIQEGNEDD